MGTGADGPGAAIAVLFVLGVLVAVVATIWKVSAARRTARDAGMDVGDATSMTLVTDDGLEATSLAASPPGRGDAAHPAEPVDPGDRVDSAETAETADAAVAVPELRPEEVAARLQELDELRAAGLVSEEEYATTRQAILDSL